jgi:hypothetical protein
MWCRRSTVGELSGEDFNCGRWVHRTNTIDCVKKRWRKGIGRLEGGELLAEGGILAGGKMGGWRLTAED